MDRRRRLVLASTLGIAALFAGAAVVASVLPSTFKPAGTTRYAMVAKPGTKPATTNSTSWSTIPGMSTSVAVPGGKVADVIITFSGEVNSCSAMRVRAVAGTGIAKPPETQFMWASGGGAESHSFTFVRKLPAGLHTVRMEWSGLTTCNQQYIGARSMVVTANIR